MSDWHHVMNGAYKKKSEEDGFMLHLHRECHRYLHDHPKELQKWKGKAERYFLDHYGTLDDWYERYGRNYL